jgi:AraC family transcriptional regulator
MNWYERMNKAIEYIENNLTGTMDFDQISKMTCQSVSNFQRVFSIITDIPVSEYIRRRKLTLAAFELQNSSIKIIDLALKYGYESPEAFSRAFHDIHGVTPTVARKEGTRLKTYPRISFLLTIKGAAVMDYRIETKESFKVYGIEGLFTTENGENLKAIPKFWQDTLEDGRYEKLVESTHLPEHDPNGLCLVNAICDYREREGNPFPYMIFAYQTDKSDTNGYTIVEIPSATWAIFRSEEHTQEETPKVMQKLTKRVYTDWLPTAGFEKVDGYELELYYGTGNKCFCETWIRVIPKI